MYVQLNYMRFCNENKNINIENVKHKNYKIFIKYYQF